MPACVYCIKVVKVLLLGLALAEVVIYFAPQLRAAKSTSESSSEREASSASGSRNEVSSSTQVAGIRITEKDAKLIGESLRLEADTRSRAKEFSGALCSQKRLLLMGALDALL